MAFMNGVLNITGKLDTLIAYKVPGIDRIIVRPKGRLSKERIKKDKAFEWTRQLNKEWPACIKLANNIRRSIHVVTEKADYNCSGALNGICKKIQLDDKNSDRGERSIYLSRSVQKLEGFSFNKYNTLDSIIRPPLDISIDRNAGIAGIRIPSLIPGLQLNNPKKQPYYRFYFVLTAVSDIIYDPAGQGSFDTVINNNSLKDADEPTPWYNWNEGSPEVNIHLALENWEPREGISLVLAGAIEFGNEYAKDDFRYVKYSGAGKILRVV